MSVLNQSGEEQVECPLCMEPLEVDDLNFYPCTCLYQICRFCWHRIRTDENGLCPACRKAYPEDPADFKPLSQEEVVRMKAEKRAKDQQRKAKITENRKHLANVRVVQRNLVFVVGLPMRLADAEILKKHEYFGKYGKIHKVVINQSTTYAGSQGPSASAYVTYQRSEDALRAIQSINNIVVDSRVIKTSLGTTKYCSHFMKNQACPKQDCMYLHDLGDPEASFTKEAMQQGKHQEFEKKLHDQLLKETAANNNNTNITNHNTNSNNRKHNTPSPSPPVGTIIITPSLDRADLDPGSQDGDDAGPEDSSSDQTKLSESSSEDGQHSVNKEAWPSLSQEMLAGSTGTSPTPSSVSSEPSHDKKHASKRDSSRAMSSHSNSTSTSSDDINIISMTTQLLEEDDDEDQPPSSRHNQQPASNQTSKESHNVAPPTSNTQLPQSLFTPDSTRLPLFTNSLDTSSSHLPLFTNSESSHLPLFTNNENGSHLQSQHLPLFTNSNTSSSQGPLFTNTDTSSAHLPPSLFNENASFFTSSHPLSNGTTTTTHSHKLGGQLHPTHNVDLISNSIPNDWCLNNGGSAGLTHLPDVLPSVSSSEDWEAAFGFRNNARLDPSNNIGSSLHQQLQQAQHNAHLNQQQQQQIHNSPLILANHLNNTAQQQMLSHHLTNHTTQPHSQQHIQQQQNHIQQQQQQLSSNYMSRHDDDLGFDPFHETQKALAEMIEKEEQRTRLSQYHQHQQAQNILQQNLLQQQHREQQQQSLLQQNLLAAQQQRESMLQRESLLQREQVQQSLLQREQAQLKREQVQQSLLAQNLLQAQVRERERLQAQVAAMFDPRATRDLSSNSNLFQKGATSPADLYTSALTNATKLLDNFCLSNSSSSPLSRSRYPPAPPPGFNSAPSVPNTFSPASQGFSPKLLDSIDHLGGQGSKLLPNFVHHTNGTTGSGNNGFQHSLNTPAAPAWDWTALDPAIMSAGQHCDVFTTPPPPGFSMRQTLDNF